MKLNLKKTKISYKWSWIFCFQYENPRQNYLLRKSILLFLPHLQLSTGLGNYYYPSLMISTFKVVLTVAVVVIFGHIIILLFFIGSISWRTLKVLLHTNKKGQQHHQEKESSHFNKPQVVLDFTKHKKLKKLESFNNFFSGFANNGWKDLICWNTRCSGFWLFVSKCFFWQFILTSFWMYGYLNDLEVILRKD